MAGIVVSIHQPNFLPWLGFFDKARSCDIFILLDNAEFEKNNFGNRTKIRTANGDTWLTVPILSKGRSGQTVADVEINNVVGWRRKHLQALRMNYSRASHCAEYVEWLASVLSKQHSSLLELNLDLLEPLLKLQCPDTHVLMASSIPIGHDLTGSARLAHLCAALGASRYLSGAGGRNYLEDEEFEALGVKVDYQEFGHPVYTQAFPGFVRGMSIVDLLLCQGPIDFTDLSREAC